MREDSGGHIPALRFHSLTRSFDGVLAATPIRSTADERGQQLVWAG